MTEKLAMQFSKKVKIKLGNQSNEEGMRKMMKLKLNYRSVQINRNKLPAQGLNPPP